MTRRDAVGNPHGQEQLSDGLAMVGLCTQPRLIGRAGPRLGYVNAAALAAIRRPQSEVPRLLRGVRTRLGLGDVFIWNTCKRFECYAWSGASGWRGRARETAVQRLTELVLGGRDPGGAPLLGVNVLRGPEALHHAMRTTLGLNSDLPGERDVVEQLRAGRRLARAAETCGRRVETWIRGLMSANALINKATAWGGFRSDYTTCAIAACTNSRSVDFSAARCVVIGRSSTSIGALRALVGDFRVQTGRLTVVSRGRKGNGRTKALRRAAGGGEVVRVADYRDDAVVREVLDADVVVFGIDRVEPVLRRSMVLGRRDFVARPLVVFDFNGRGSTEGLAEMPGVTVYDSGLLAAAVAKQADRRCRGATFERAVVEAERMALSAVDGMDCPSSVWAETA